MFEDKVVLGLTEEVTLCGKEVTARIDSGATIGSIDESFAVACNTEPVGTKLVRSSHGVTRRDVVELDIVLENKTVVGKFTVFDRSSMTYPILIRQDVLKQGFIIDPNKGEQ